MPDDAPVTRAAVWEVGDGSVTAATLPAHLSPHRCERGAIRQTVAVGDEGGNDIDLAVDPAAIVDALPDGIVVIDHLARVLWVNPRFTELTGWTINDIRGRNGLDLIDPAQ